MRYEIQATKEDLKVINTAPQKSHRYGLGNVHVRMVDEKILIESTDTYILIRKSFDIKSGDPEKQPQHALLFNPEFFKRLIYLCKQKEIITIIIDFDEKTITGKTLYCEISSQHVTEVTYPDTDRVYPETDGDVEIIFRKETLEKFLNSVPNSEQFLKFCFQSASEPWEKPTVVRTSEDSGVWSEDRNLIMGVRPNGTKW